MSKSINILDKEYISWVRELCHRYRRSQIKAAVKVNQEMLRFYWSVWRDILTLKAEARWGDNILNRLSTDLKHEMPDASGLSARNLLYMRNFYELYNSQLTITPQVVAQLEMPMEFTPQSVAQMDSVEITPQVVEQLGVDIFAVPWGHHRYIINRQSHHRPPRLQGQRQHHRAIRPRRQQPTHRNFRI